MEGLIGILSSCDPSMFTFCSHAATPFTCNTNINLKNAIHPHAGLGLFILKVDHAPPENYPHPYNHQPP